MTVLGSRRRTSGTLLAGVIAALLVLTGCSTGDGDEAPSGSGAEGDLPAAEGTTEYPLALETAWGETVLEERPDRIAAISPTARDVELLAMLGVTPVIAPQPVERATWTLDALPGEIETIYEADASGITPHEAVAAAEPDLIIVFGKSIADEYEQLSAIAPIVGAPTEEAATLADWKAELRAIAAALDLSGAAEEAIAAHDDWFETVRAENPEFEGLTATYLVQYSAESGLHYFSSTGSDPEQLLLDLGFEPNPLAEGFVDDPLVSSELLSQIEADVLIVANTSNSEDELEQVLTGTELFQNLDVVQRGDYAILNSTESGYEFDGEEYEGNLAWALAASGPLGKQWAAEQLVPVLQSALA